MYLLAFFFNIGVLLSEFMPFSHKNEGVSGENLVRLNKFAPITIIGFICFHLDQGHTGTYILTAATQIEVYKIHHHTISNHLKYDKRFGAQFLQSDLS